MTPTEIETACRQRYNAVGDAFFTQTDIMTMIWQACMELARKAQVIQRTLTTTTVSGTQEYAYPTNMMAPRRVTWNGTPLIPINFKEDDAITGGDSDTTSTGEPTSYFIWNYSMYLRPIPNAAQTLQVFSYSEPTAVTSSSTLEVPTEYHGDIVNFVLREMCAKDKNYQGAAYYGTLWDKAVENAVRWERKKKRMDSLANAMPSDLMTESVSGW